MKNCWDSLWHSQGFKQEPRSCSWNQQKKSSTTIPAVIVHLFCFNHALNLLNPLLSPDALTESQVKWNLCFPTASPALCSCRSPDLQDTAINAAARQREHSVLLGTPPEGNHQLTATFLGVFVIWKGFKVFIPPLVALGSQLWSWILQVSTTALRIPVHDRLLNWSCRDPGWFGALNVLSTVTEIQYYRPR